MRPGAERGAWAGGVGALTMCLDLERGWVKTFQPPREDAQAPLSAGSSWRRGSPKTHHELRGPPGFSAFPLPGTPHVARRPLCQFGRRWPLKPLPACPPRLACKGLGTDGKPSGYLALPSTGQGNLAPWLQGLRAVVGGSREGLDC